MDPVTQRVKTLMKLMVSDNTRRFSGLLAPWVSLVGVDVAGGSVTFELTVGAPLTNMNDTLHGGATATAVDVLSTIALVALAPDKTHTGGVSADIDVRYLRSAPAGSTVSVVCKAAKVGSRLAFLEVTGTVGAKLCFTATHIKFIGSHKSLKSKL